MTPRVNLETTGGMALGLSSKPQIKKEKHISPSLCLLCYLVAKISDKYVILDAQNTLIKFPFQKMVERTCSFTLTAITTETLIINKGP